MARVSVSTKLVVRTGLDPALTAPTVDGDVIDAGLVALMVTNAAGAPINVTAKATAVQDGLALSDNITAVPAGATRLIGPFPARSFGRLSGADVGRVYIDYSSVTSITRSVISIPS